jgi:hypothetical protein
MNIEAFIAIALFTLILGVVIFFPVYFVVMRKLRKNPHHAMHKVTKAGFVAYGIMVAVLMCGLSLEYFAPESWIGQLVMTFPGRVIYTLLVAAGFVPVGVYLKRKGINLVEKKKLDVESEKITS